MILDKYTTFKELVDTINLMLPDSVAELSHAGKRHIGIHLSHAFFPISINEQEFNYMHDVIVSNNLKNGFELATGTGISTISIGMAMKKIGGHLITLDSYYEEVTQVSENIEGTYIDQEKIKNVKGWQFISNVIKKFNLENSVDQCAGWSPSDSIRLLKNNTQPLDFVFLDCPKSLKEIKRDITYLKEFVSKEKYIVFIHDINDEKYRKEVSDMLMDFCGWKLSYKEEYYVGTSHYKKVFFPIHFVNHNCNL